MHADPVDTPDFLDDALVAINRVAIDVSGEPYVANDRWQGGPCVIRNG